MKIPVKSPLLKLVVLREMAKRNCPYTKTGLNLRGKERHSCRKLSDLVNRDYSWDLAQSYRPCSFSDYLSCELCFGAMK